jgi:hypothetical protein
MVFRWSAAALAKTKATALIATSLAAGGVGGAVALNHVAAPTTHVITTAADSSLAPEALASADPETTDSTGGDPETVDSTGGDPETVDSTGGDPETGDSTGGDPETGDSTGGDPETGDAGGGTDTFTLPPCPADIRNHGAYVSMVAKAAPQGDQHGYWV